MSTGQALTLGVTGETARAVSQQPRLLFHPPLMSGPMEEMSPMTKSRTLARRKAERELLD